MRRCFAPPLPLGLVAVEAACGDSGQSLAAGSTPVTATPPDATNFDGERNTLVSVHKG
jgi:hypothetical protein